jgi:hypothetical protein
MGGTLITKVRRQRRSRKREEELESHDWGHNELIPWSEEEESKIVGKYNIRNRM